MKIQTLYIFVLALFCDVKNGKCQDRNTANLANSDTVYEVFDQLPSFPGGSSAFNLLALTTTGLDTYDLTGENTQTKNAMDEEEYIVEKNGSLTFAKSVKHTGRDLSPEISQIFAKMPAWIPAKIKDTPVRSSIIIRLDLMYGYLTASYHISPCKICKNMVSPPEEMYEYFIEQPSPLVENGNLKEYLADHILYPKKAKRHRAEGIVKIKLYIDDSGYITKTAIDNDPIGYGCGAEADRVLQTIKWRPAKINGRPSKSIILVHVDFYIKGKDK